MGARFRSWWQQIKTHPVVTALIAFVIALVVLVILGGYLYHWDWTGFNGNSKSGKTLWDWLQLLIIPVVLAAAGYAINLTISRSEQNAIERRAQTEREVAEKQAQAEREAAEKHAQTERDVALDNQREAALQAYIDNMSELLLREKLRESKPEVEVSRIARVRTLTVLPRLDGNRKASVLQFLHESGLIDKSKRIVDLSGADLHEADLFFADLSKANLSGARLRGANLHGADLRNAELVGTSLRRANLSEANLSLATMYEADLLGAYLTGATLTEASLTGARVNKEQLDKVKSLQGAIMPDGSIHPWSFPLRYTTVSLPLPQNRTRLM